MGRVLRSSRKAMVSIPNEILEVVLLHLSTKDLLNCREVSKKWKEVCTGISRRRRIRLRLSDLDSCNWNSREMLALQKIYKRSSSVPWSSCVVKALKHSSLYNIQRFVQLCGNHLKEIEVRITYYIGIWTLLNGAPYVEELIFHKPTPFAERDNVLPQARLDLAWLQRLDFVIRNRTYVDFLERILACSSARPKDIRLKVYGYMDINFSDAERLACLVNEFSSIKLEFHLTEGSINVIRAFTWESLKVTELAFDMSSVGPFDPTHYKDLYEFLLSVSGSLEILSIKPRSVISKRKPTSNNLLELPKLPVLKSLTLNALDHRQTQRLPRNHSSSFLQQFTEPQFPSLVYVKARIYYCSTTPFRTCRFSNVTTLSLEMGWKSAIRVGPSYWNRIFPCLKGLTTKVYSEGFQFILKYMTHLEFLSINLASTDINGLLCGFHPPEETMSVRQIRNRVADNSLPSLLSMKGLTTLKLTLAADNPSNRLQDYGVIGSLLKMQPLKSLCLKNVNISQKCKKKLEGYHISVLID